MSHSIKQPNLNSLPICRSPVSDQTLCGCDPNLPFNVKGAIVFKSLF